MSTSQRHKVVCAGECGKRTSLLCAACSKSYCFRCRQGYMSTTGNAKTCMHPKSFPCRCGVFECHFCDYAKNLANGKRRRLNSAVVPPSLPPPPQPPLAPEPDIKNAFDDFQNLVKKALMVPVSKRAQATHTHLEQAKEHYMRALHGFQQSIAELVAANTSAEADVGVTFNLPPSFAPVIQSISNEVVGPEAKRWQENHFGERITGLKRKLGDMTDGLALFTSPDLSELIADAFTCVPNQPQNAFFNDGRDSHTLGQQLHFYWVPHVSEAKASRLSHGVIFTNAADKPFIAYALQLLWQTKFRPGEADSVDDCFKYGCFYLGYHTHDAELFHAEVPVLQPDIAARFILAALQKKLQQAEARIATRGTRDTDTLDFFCQVYHSSSVAIAEDKKTISDGADAKAVNDVLRRAISKVLSLEAPRQQIPADDQKFRMQCALMFKAPDVDDRATPDILGVSGVSAAQTKLACEFTVPLSQTLYFPLLLQKLATEYAIPSQAVASQVEEKKGHAPPPGFALAGQAVLPGAGDRDANDDGMDVEEVAAPAARAAPAAPAGPAAAAVEEDPVS